MTDMPQASVALSYSLAHSSKVTGTTHQNKSLRKKQGLTCNDDSSRSNYAAKMAYWVWEIEVLQELGWVVKPSVGGYLDLIITGTKNVSLWENVGMKWVFYAWWAESP